MTSLTESAGLIEVADQVRSGALTASQVTQEILDRIGTRAASLNCYAVVTDDHAATQAAWLDRQRATRGRPAGPLDGVTLSLKDNICLTGAPTTCGSAVLCEWQPKSDAWVVERLTGAGAVIVGKTAMYEFAYGGVHPDFGDVSNPWNVEYGCCGSSSGSAAAVAAGLCHASIGTDSGGSVRLPAAMCGVVGLKPTFGLLPVRGVLPLSESLDTLGVLARSVPDCMAVLSALVAPVATAGAAEPAPARVAVLDLEDHPVDDDVRAAFDRAVEQVAELGCTLSSVRLPELWSAVPTMWAIADTEGYVWHEPLLAIAGDRYGREARIRLEAGRLAAASDYIRALHLRDVWRRRLDEVFDSVDFVMTPTTPRAWYAKRDAPAARTDGSALEIGRFTAVFNLTGNPAITLPCGTTPDGFPVGVQFAGRRLADRELIAFATRFGAATPHGARPPSFD